MKSNGAVSLEGKSSAQNVSLANKHHQYGNTKEHIGGMFIYYCKILNVFLWLFIQVKLGLAGYSRSLDPYVYFMWHRLSTGYPSWYWHMKCTDSYSLLVADAGSLTSDQTWVVAVKVPHASQYVTKKLFNIYLIKKQMCSDKMNNPLSVCIKISNSH